mgnify:CR=1 FL=1
MDRSPATASPRLSTFFANPRWGELSRSLAAIFGGYGFMNEYPVARFWRDSKVLEIGEGTNEVQRMLIARELGLGR